MTKMLIIKKIKFDIDIINNLLVKCANAPESQIDFSIRYKFIKFLGEEHTYLEKYDFIVSISKEELHMIDNKFGVGLISKFVKEICALDKYMERPLE